MAAKDGSPGDAKEGRVQDGTPVGLDDIAAAAGFPEPADPYGASHAHLFAAWEDGKPLVLVHRNGMKWRNALAAVFATPAFGAMSEDAAAERIEGCELFAVAVDATFEAVPVKAARRAAGTGPTTSYTRQRYLSLLEALRWREEDHPLPALDREARGMVAVMSDDYAARKDAGILPASRRQLDYAASLASDLGVPFPFGPDANRTEIGDFISDAKVKVAAMKEAGRRT